jgi:hypothetical protein
MIRCYERHALEVSLVEVQKLMYFLQEAGEPLNLRFAKAHYGPYADNLRHVLSAVEGHYLSGDGDGSAPLCPPSRSMSSRRRTKPPYVNSRARTRPVSGSIACSTSSGYESMYGMELLSSVHWVVTRDDPTAMDDAPKAAELIRSWTRRKSNLCTDDHVGAALATLRDRGWLPAAIAEHA